MPDAPKCHFCKANNITSQTYKVARKAAFKCQRCGKESLRSEYYENDFNWKEKA